MTPTLSKHVLLAWMSLGALTATAAEKKLARADVPPKVIDAVTRAMPKAELTAFSVEDEDGGKVYEVSTRLNGKVSALSVSPEGKILSEEKVVSEQELPTAVLNGFHASAFGKAKILKAEQVTPSAEGSASTYELQVTVGQKRHELTFDAKGVLVKDEKY